MSESTLMLRLARVSPYRIIAEWQAFLDPKDGEQMRDALTGAVKAAVGDDWRSELPRHELLWRWGPSCGWRTFRAGK